MDVLFRVMQLCLFEKSVDRQDKCDEVDNLVQSGHGHGFVSTRLGCMVNVNHGSVQLQAAGRVGPYAELTKTLLLRYQIAVSWVLTL